MCVRAGQAIAWVCEKSPRDIKQLRERMISQIEEAGKQLRASGLCQQWFNGSDEVVRDVGGQCNGHLFEQLLRAYGYHDWECVYLLRTG